MDNSQHQFEYLSQGKMKFIRSLQQKKARDQNKLFVVEGDKIVREYLNASKEKRCRIKYLCGTLDWMQRSTTLLEGAEIDVSRINYKDLKRISSLITPQEVLAVVEMNGPVYNPSILKNDLTLAFGSIRNPGNFGTIIRTADWFGIKTILCSSDSVDVNNPKVIQSAMGSTLRVNIFYKPLPEFLSDARKLKIPVYGTFMDGENLYEASFPENLIILFGNESTGIEETIVPLINKKISIPEFPADKKSTESLNIASAMAIISSEIRRRER